MGIRALGISGSPVKNSNTDRLVQSISDAIGLESERSMGKRYSNGPPDRRAPVEKVTKS